MKSLAVMTLKGGAGKTTTALCLAVGLARRGHRVLAIDADPQSNMTMTLLDGDPAHPPTLGHVLLDQADVEDAIRPTRVKGLDVLPSDAQLADAALLLSDVMGREKRMRNALEAIADSYDYAVVDSAPQMSLVSVNVLNAVEGVIVPVDAGVYSVSGLGRLQETVEQVRRYLDNPGLHIAGLVMTRTHNNRATKDIEAQLREAFGPLLYKSTIPHSVRVEEAHARHRTVLEFSPTSAPAKAYETLLTEILTHGEQQQPRRSRNRRRTDPADAA